VEALILKATQHMDNYAYYQAVSELLQFCTVELSGLAFDIHKDTLYTLAENDLARRSAQTVFHHALQALVRLFAPVMPFTCEEAWGHMPEAWKQGHASVHFASWPLAQPGLRDAQVAEEFALFFDKVRPVVTKKLEEARAAKLIGHPYDAEVVLSPHSKQVYRLLAKHEPSLAAWFVVSKVALKPAAPQDGAILAPEEVEIRVSAHPKCARCWRHVEDVGQHAEHPALCGRCVGALAQ
jgi:isoleucyl-tRNA synthetase